jgi:hypothetical protein
MEDEDNIRRFGRFFSNDQSAFSTIAAVNDIILDANHIECPNRGAVYPLNLQHRGSLELL